MEGEPLVKGRILRAYAKYIKKRWGQEGLDQCTRDIAFDAGTVPEEKWVPNRHQGHILQWLHDNHGDEAVRRAGFAMVSERGVLSVVARLAGFERVLDQGVKEIRDSVQQGAVDIEKGDGTATITLMDLADNPCSCIAWTGVFEGVLHITKTRGRVRKTGCQHRGDAACTYVIEWE